MKLAFVYAGQGSQYVGMGKDLYENNTVFKNVIDQVDEDGLIKNFSFYGEIETLSKTENTQPCMVAFAVAMTETLRSQGIVPEMVTGLSLGEYSALSASGVFTATQAVKLARFRGRAMANAVKDTPSAMMAVLGGDRIFLQEACDIASSFGVTEIANYNCPGQIVIGGEKLAVEKTAEVALKLGVKRCIPLQVSGPFHTSLMKPAGDELAKKFKETTFGEMKFPVVFNTTAKEIQSTETIAELLEKQVQTSVNFEDSIRYMESCGIDTIIEIGPGKVLSGFIKKISKTIKTYQAENCESLEKILAEFALKGDS